MQKPGPAARRVGIHVGVHIDIRIEVYVHIDVYVGVEVHVEVERFEVEQAEHGRQPEQHRYEHRDGEQQQRSLKKCRKKLHKISSRFMREIDKFSMMIGLI